MIFDVLKEQLGGMIVERWFSPVPNKFKVKLMNQVRLRGHPGKARYVLSTMESCVSIILEEDIFKVNDGVVIANNLGFEHIRPYIREAEEVVQHWHAI